MADSRGAHIRRTYAAFKERLLKCLQRVRGGDWFMWECDDVPKSQNSHDSGVLFCLNCIAFAMNIMQRNLEDCKFASVFSYDAEPQFLQKARQFIGNTVYNMMSYD